MHKVPQRFGGGAVIFVGDRGMIKGPQIRQLQAEKDHLLVVMLAYLLVQELAKCWRGLELTVAERRYLSLGWHSCDNK